MAKWSVAVHGGAGVVRGRNYAAAEVCMAQVAKEAARDLRAGGSSLDIVERAVAALEASGLFVAGRGAAPNGLGQLELDASIMDGSTGKAGAIAALGAYPSPVAIARRLADLPDVVFLVGQGAARFAATEGFLPVPEPVADWLRKPDGFDPSDVDGGHGTVGAVALDIHGHLAAATSTGGLYGARPGRVGDSPVIGAGVWADDQVAVSCTGQGEAFLRVCAAYDLAARMRYANEECTAAAQKVLDAVRCAGGDGGLVAVTRDGQIITPYNTDGMKRAWASSEGEVVWVGSVGADMVPAGEL